MRWLTLNMRKKVEVLAVKENKEEDSNAISADDDTAKDTFDEESPQKNEEEAYHTSNGEYDNYDGHDGYDGYEDRNERKIFLSRIPATFDEEAVTRALGDLLGREAIENVSLSAPKSEDDGAESNKTDPASKEHLGFAFVTLSSLEKKEEALKKETIKCKAKSTSKRKYTLYIRPVVSSDQDENGEMADGAYDALNTCFLWNKFRCPYGDECKFQHIGEGGCVEKKDKADQTVDKRSKQKCFVYKMTGKCKKGETCPYRHDFEPRCKIVPSDDAATHQKKETKDKDCFNWKTKGKCRKGDKCPYKHCELVREAFLAKKNKAAGTKRSRDESNGKSSNPQPLSVRVFGLNYDTKEEDVRKYFAHCGTIKEITFPIYEDSGRSKGYCGVLFTSPKATAKACEMDGLELNGRWLSVQSGKMYLRQWEEREKNNSKPVKSKESSKYEEQVGEYGQKVKKRKKHGFKEDS